MLTAMRKNRKFLNVFLWIVIFAFLATIFVVWGMGDKQSEGTYAARIGNRIVTYNEYRNAYESKVNELRSNLGEYAEQIIKDNSFAGYVLDSLVNSKLLLLEADHLKIPVGNAEVAENIINEPAFMTNMSFDPERYAQVLSYAGYTPSAYENEVANMIKLNKLQQIIDGAISVSDNEINLEHIYANTEVSVSYFTVTDSAYKTGLIPTEEELAVYFGKNQEKYRLSAKVKVKYALFNIDNFTYVAEISDDAVRERYTAKIADYTDGDAVRTFDETKDEIRAVMADEYKKNAYRSYLYSLYRAIMGVSNLTAYLNENPNAFEIYESDLLAEDDPLAFFQGNSELKKALFTTGKSEITPPLDIQNSTYIFEIVDRVNSAIPPLEDVLPSVAADWKSDAAFNAAFADVNAKIDVETASADDFKALAKQFKADVKTVPSFRRYDVAPNAPWVADLAAVLFKGDKDDILKYPAPDSAQVYVLRINEIALPREDGITKEESAALFQYLLSVKREDARAALIRSLKTKYKVVVNQNIAQY